MLRGYYSNLVSELICLMKYLQSGIRGEACYLAHSNITLKSLNASGNIQPKFVDAVQGIALLEAYRTNGGSIVCKYTRTAAVPATSMYYMYDLREPHYTMYAFGRTLAPNSFPAAHKPKPERGHSKELVVFVPEMVFLLVSLYSFLYGIETNLKFADKFYKFSYWFD